MTLHIQRRATARNVRAALAFWVALAWCALAATAWGQASVYRVMGFDFTLSGSAAIAYNSNVDGAYPEEEKENYRKDDFFVTPALTLSAAPIRISQHTTVTLGGTVGYEKYFERRDLDTETYDASLTISTVLRSLSLTTGASIERSTENSEDETYRPGGYSRDPSETEEANFAAAWSSGKLSLNFSSSFTRERHDYEEYKDSDQDETQWSFDAGYSLSSWASLVFSHSWDRTETIETGEVETKIEDDIGITLNWPYGPHPQIALSLGFGKERGNKVEDGKDWKPVFDISVSDAYNLTRDTQVSAGFAWGDDKEEDEVSFTYNAQITQRLSTFMTHSLAFSCEPLETFGSDAETESTSYTYSASISPFFIQGLSLSGSWEYSIDKPLEKDSETEKTTTYNAALSHSRALSRKLSRSLSYSYTWENSNFHHDGANEEHLVTYQLNYIF